MILAWLGGHEAAEIGVALADQFAPRSHSAGTERSPRGNDAESMKQLLRRADSEVRPLQLNFYKKAKFANSFKWRLIENGVEKVTADDVTQLLVMHLSTREIAKEEPSSAAAPANRSEKARAQHLFVRGNKFFAQAAYAEAAGLYEEAVELDSSHAEALNNLGAALSHLGRYEEAEQLFRGSIAIKPHNADAHGNLGNILRQNSDFVGAELSLRRALKLRPNFSEARINLGLTLTFLGRLRDARACFAKVLKKDARNVQALHGMGQLDAFEGRFEEADANFKRVVELDPKMPAAWASLAGTRKMTNADGEWFRSAEAIAASAKHPLEEANLRFAMGKYCDDVNDFARAFENFRRGNELMKTAAQKYDRKGRSNLIEGMIRGYTREAISNLGAAGSTSTKPVFVVGMPRSGTSLAEQIIASHPAAYGAGELHFWEMKPTPSILSETARLEVAKDYLRLLEGRSASASRVIDKAPVNSDFLGPIYSVFPKARVIYMQRDPIDTCLSCYFQQFLLGINFASDLSDLAHYYREHRRIMAHWREVLPSGFILEVPYAELVSDQEMWSRKMLDFIGLEWDPRVLEFQTTKRQVVTASAWQVRQKIYRSSVARWRNYEKFIGPLKALQK
jgi:tetratricopeptide (TPR) repeat protein